jgi:hypothetical protein
MSMALLEFQKAAGNDHDFAWEVYAQNVASFRGGQFDADEEKSKLQKRWDHNTARIITCDGEKIGWFSCVSQGKELVIEDLHVLQGNRGIRTFVLDLILVEAMSQQKKPMACALSNEGSANLQKVSLCLAKDDPAVDFFKKSGCAVVEESPTGDLRIDVSDTLERSHQKWVK